MLGGNAVASGNVAYGPDGVIRFSRLRLAAPLLRVFDGKGSYVAGGPIAITANGHSTRYGPLAVELDGTVANPRLALVARNPGLGVGLANLRARVTGSGGGYRFDATGDTDYGPLAAEVRLIQGRGPLTLQIDRGDLAGIGFTGRLQKSAAGPFIGQLDASGRGLAGVVRLGAAGRYQEALVNFRAQDTVLPGPAQLAIGSAIVDARVVLYERPWVVADVQLAQTRLRGLDLAAARAKIDYRDGRGTARFLAEGISGAPFRDRRQRPARTQPVARGARRTGARHRLQDREPGAHRALVQAATSCCRRGSISARAACAWPGNMDRG